MLPTAALRILHDNMLIGAIPMEIGMLKSLKVVDLGRNQLTGPIPHEIGKLSNIKTMNFQSNGLTGRLPPQFGKLKYLEELFIDRNKLRGTVPASNDSDFTINMHGLYTSNGQPVGLCRASRLKVADLSYNFFVGSIPKCLERLPRSSFQGNCLQAKDIKQRPSAQCVGAATHAKLHSEFDPKNHLVADIPKRHATTSKHALLLALEIGIGVIVGSLFVVALFTFLQKFKNKASIVIPWKRSGSQNNYQAVYIG
ncbi:hypothetical protein Leryth_008915 [Lithospermum erythrorhizon]|nr:hypothetical protein Leryth_008915 [Lithospermum erythrorhizon]